MFFATRDRDKVAVELINKLGLKFGIEIGVRDGEFAEHLLRNTEIELRGVDIVVRQRTRLKLYKNYQSRYCLYEGRSPDFSSHFEDDVFDFIYIDADHSYDAVNKDLEAWWPKLKNGGVFCGDDYAFVNNPVEGVYGVVEAVNEFVDLHNLKLKIAGLDTDDRSKMLEYAVANGEQATKFLRNQKYEQFQNPMWYVIKE